MLGTHLRQAAVVLLESAIRIAPPDTRDWGRAIRGELDYVETPWAGTMWALGGAGVLVKYALRSLIIPGRRGEVVVPDGGLFAKSAALRKAALIAGAACVLVAMLFFAAPPFRQAFGVAMKPWLVMYQTARGNSHPAIGALAKQAQIRHDPEGLAFCAVRDLDPRESVRLAEEAVRLDPNLIWVYAVVAIHSPGFAPWELWVKKLERWEPQNALFFLITAEALEQSHWRGGDWIPETEEQERAWQSAMAAAFRSPRFNDYLDRVAELNRRVVPRYAYYDPFEVQSRDQIGLPSYALDDLARFAQSLMHSGAELEAQGHRKEGRDQYWAVARFGQLLDSQGRIGLERWMGTTLQSMAYRQLGASFEREGNLSEVQLLGYLATKFDPAKGDRPAFLGESAFGAKVAERNASVVEISGLMILVFCGFLVIAAAILIVGSRPGARPVARRARPVATIVALTGAVGLLFSSVTLYLTYRPYWYIFQSAILSGDCVPTSDLRYFLNACRMIPGVSPRGSIVLLDALLYSGSPSFLFYVWTGVTLLGVIGLALILLRRFLGRWHAHAP